jgi:hypothetical protein
LPAATTRRDALELAPLRVGAADIKVSTPIYKRSRDSYNTAFQSSRCQN